MTTEYNTDAIREMVLAALSAEEIDQLIFDHFREVNDRLSDSMTQSQRVQELLSYLTRTGRIHEIIDHVERINPFQYKRFQENLVAQSLLSLRPQKSDLESLIQTYLLAMDTLIILERHMARYTSQFVPSTFLLELQARRKDVYQLGVSITEEIRREREHIHRLHEKADKITEMVRLCHVLMQQKQAEYRKKCGHEQ